MGRLDLSALPARLEAMRADFERRGEDAARVLDVPGVGCHADQHVWGIP